MALALSHAAEKVGIEVTLGASPTDAQRLFQQMLPPEFFLQRRQKEELRRNTLADNIPAEAKNSKRKKRNKTLRQNSRVYNDSVVMWLMIVQRLKGGGTMEDAVLELLRGLPDSFWPKPCKRLLATPDGEKPFLSNNLGSYNNARQALPLTVVEQAFDHVLEQLIARSAPVARKLRAFFLDGTTVRMPHNPEMCAAYPPARNWRKS